MYTDRIFVEPSSRQLMLHLAEIGQKLVVFVFALGLVAPSKNRRGMDRDEHCRPQLAGEELTALAADRDDSTEYRLCRGHAEANQNFRLNDFQLRFEPGLTGSDLANRRFLM